MTEQQTEDLVNGLWTGNRLWVLGSVLVVPVFATVAGLGSLIASPRHLDQDGR